MHIWTRRCQTACLDEATPMDPNRVLSSTPTRSKRKCGRACRGRTPCVQGGGVVVAVARHVCRVPVAWPVGLEASLGFRV